MVERVLDMVEGDNGSFVELQAKEREEAADKKRLRDLIILIVLLFIVIFALGMVIGWYMYADYNPYICECLLYK